MDTTHCLFFWLIFVRCFGLLISPGREVPDREMHLLDVVSLFLPLPVGNSLRKTHMGICCTPTFLVLPELWFKEMVDMYHCLLRWPTWHWVTSSRNYLYFMVASWTTASNTGRAGESVTSVILVFSFHLQMRNVLSHQCKNVVSQFRKKAVSRIKMLRAKTISTGTYFFKRDQTCWQLQTCAYPMCFF